jgi:hypothetical protein
MPRIYNVTGRTAPRFGEGFKFQTTIKARNRTEASRAMSDTLCAVLCVPFEFTVEE